MQSKRNTLNPRTKQLMHSAIEGDPSVIPIVHQLYRYRDHEKFLKWLIRNRITGKYLSEWVKIQFGNSVMGMVKFIVMHHEKNRTTKPIVLGKDWQ